MGGIILALAVTVSLGGPLPSWQGEQMKSWQKGSHQIASVRCERGVLTGVAKGSDPFWTTGVKPFRPTATQEVIFRAKCPVDGKGEFYWAPVGASAPVQATGVSFDWIGDGEWHEYRVRPFWQGGGDIHIVRVDYPSTAAEKGEIGLSDVRVVEGAKTEALPLAGAVGVSFSCRATGRGTGAFEWAVDSEPGLRRTKFPLTADGRFHRHFLALGPTKGNLVWHRFSAVRSAVLPEVTDFRICSTEPDLAADLLLVGANFVTPACRAGTEGRIEVSLRNLGTDEAREVTLRAVSAPDGLRTGGGETVGAPQTILGGEEALLALPVRSEKPLEGRVIVEISWTGENGERGTLRQAVPVKVLPSLGLAKADYVPEPKPAKCDYEIGALYFPGWVLNTAWKRVWRTCPERRPVLGWYDEANPEVVDWQIKWLVENGIRELYVDWYWHKGGRHLEHWVKAFEKARWKKYLKWAMMWANHNAAGSHSEKDQREVTQYWLDHCFNMPEYLMRDGKPVVWIWAPDNYGRDLGAGGCRRMLDLSRQMAVAAGYGGIHFIAMKWPEVGCEPQTIRKYKELGFDEVGIYHFMGHGGKAESPNRYSYKVVAEANPDNWRKQFEANVMPFLPNLSTGWDDRPWNDHCEIYGKNADDFRRLCREAKKFADETGIKRLCLSPLNEWGEGSYAEPNAEHGFGFYEAVRETFCERPEGGWRPNVTPADVGLGPYDLPLPASPRKVTAWDFTDGEKHGWRAFMGCSRAVATKEGFVMETDSRDPAMSVPFVQLKAREFKSVTVRMKAEGAKGNAVLFWAREENGMNGRANSALRVRSDGQFHDYVFPVGSHGLWRGRIGALRFDPCENAGAKVTVASVRLD